MQNSKLEQYVSKVGDLPPMPDVAAGVLRAAESDDCSAGDLRKIIERDPAIVARILKVSNSALYGFTRQIDTLSHALALLGMQTVKNLVLAASLRQVFKRFGLMEKLLFEHASITGPVASRVAREVGGKGDPEEAFVAGILHDIGQIVLANNHRDEYERVVARTYNEGIGFVEAERAAFGFHHAELGGAVARLWQLSELQEAVIRCHHEPELLVDLPPEAQRLTAIVTVASSALTKLGVGRRGPAESLDPQALGAWELLGLTCDDVERVVKMCEEEAERARALVE